MYKSRCYIELTVVHQYVSHYQQLLLVITAFRFHYSFYIYTYKYKQMHVDRNLRLFFVCIGNDYRYNTCRENYYARGRCLEMLASQP